MAYTMEDGNREVVEGWSLVFFTLSAAVAISRRASNLINRTYFQMSKFWSEVKNHKRKRRERRREIKMKFHSSG